MTITLTLAEALKYANDWSRFCEITGYSEYAVAEGGGDIKIDLTLDQAVELGIIQFPHG